LKQQALLYAQEFQIQQLERKVRRAQGDRTDEEKEILLKRIEELTKDLEDQTKKYGLLNTQLKSSQEDLRQATRNYEKLTKEHRAVNEEIDELNLYNDSASHQLSAKTKEKEELFVESNLLRLELKKLRGFLSTRADQVFTLESRQLQLHLSLEERSKEIEINKEMLRLQIKTAQEERGSAHAELRDRVGKVEKLKRRYEILMTQFAPPEDGEDEDGSGEERTQAFYVIKAAQEREELQREGDELDAKIRKAEKEIKALENTLIMMNDRNEEYRMHLYKAELNAKDVQHKELLDQEYRQIMEQYKLKRLEIQDMQNDLLETERQLASLTTEESQRLQTVQLLESKISTLQRESGDQEAKRDRALKLARKKAKEWRSKAGAVIASEGGKIFGPGIVNEKDATPEEIDVMVRYLKDVGTIMIGDLNKVAERYPELSMRIHHLFEQSGIQQPSRAISRISSNDGYRDDMSVAGTPESRSSVHSRVSTNSLRNSVSRASGPVRSTTGSRLDMNAIVTLPSVSNNQNFPSRSSSSLQHYVTGSGNNPVVIPVPNNAQVNSSSGSSTPKRSSVRASRRGSAGSVGTQPK
ncbi:Coiled-coil domain-containing protein 39, partial [Nowakowskiella sp. JEL0407]